MVERNPVGWRGAGMMDCESVSEWEKEQCCYTPGTRFVVGVVAAVTVWVGDAV